MKSEQKTAIYLLWISCNTRRRSWECIYPPSELKLLAFNAQKNFGGHVTLAKPPFWKLLRGHVWTVPGNMLVKFEVRSFNCFGAIIDQYAEHRQTCTPQNENSISAIHSVQLTDIITFSDKNVQYSSHKGLENCSLLVPNIFVLAHENIVLLWRSSFVVYVICLVVNYMTSINVVF